MVPSRLETYKTLRVSLLDVAFSTAFGTLFGGAFLVGFVRACNGGDVWLGFLSAIGSLFGILQIPGAIWGRGFSSYKRFVWPGGLAWRLLYIPIAVLPILAIQGNAKLLIAATLIIIGAASVQLVNPIYTDWLAEIVPANSRGAYFTKRNAIATGVGSGIAIVGGAIIDTFRHRHNLQLGLALIFGLGVSCGMISFYYFWQMADQPRERPIREPVWQGVKAIATPFKNKRYRPVLVYLAIGVFSRTFPQPFFAAYALETLKLPFLVITICGAMQSLSIILFSPLVGFFTDKFGNKPILVIGGLSVAINPVLWMLAKDGQLFYDTVYLLICHLFFGIAWAIIGPGQGNLMLNTAPNEDRANYLGAGNAVISIVAGVSPLVGSFLMVALRHTMTAGSAYRMMFALSGLMRLVTLLFLIPVREKGAVGFKEAMSQITSSSPRSMRAARKLSDPLTPDQREATLARLTKQPSDMAAVGLVRALADPLPRVRRQAARAISKLASPLAQSEAAHAIILLIQQHPDMVEEETLEALTSLDELGSIPGAVQCLTELLSSPRGPIKRAAAQAMGRVGGTEAVGPLTQTVQSGDPDLRRAALQALRILGDNRAAPTIIAALHDDRASVATAAAEAISELKLKSAAPEIRRILSTAHDDPTRKETWPLPSLTYSLGMVGDQSDIDLVLRTTALAKTTHGRRMGLLGSAHLLGVEPESYRLMLATGLERDSALLEAVRPIERRFKGAESVLMGYSSASALLHRTGGEADRLANAQFITGLKLPVLSSFGLYSIDESFLVVVAYANRICTQP